jgi:hypothetical protein
MKTCKKHGEYSQKACPECRRINNKKNKKLIENCLIHNIFYLQTQCPCCRKEKRQKDKGKIKNCNTHNINYWQSHCPICRSEYNKIYNAEHKEEKKLKNRAYEQKNKDKINAKARRNRAKKRKFKETAEYKNVRNLTPIRKIRGSISASILKMLKSNGGSKQGKSILDNLPHKLEEFENHIEALFYHPDNLGSNGDVWMNWNNFGQYRFDIWVNDNSFTWVWNLDHIIPHCNFQYSSMKDQLFKDCWALSNLRPYSAKQNIIDGDRKNKV